MASVNKVIVLGNLGNDPEYRSTPSGQGVCTLSIATNEKWKDKNTGDMQERTEWHRVVVWGRLADLCRDYLSKGRSVYIEGRLQTRKWEDKQGQTRYTTEIIAQTVQFIGARGEGGGQNYGSGQSSSSSSQSSAGGDEPPPFGDDDDIPF